MASSSLVAVWYQINSSPRFPCCWLCSANRSKKPVLAYWPQWHPLICLQILITTKDAQLRALHVFDSLIFLLNEYRVYTCVTHRLTPICSHVYDSSANILYIHYCVGCSVNSLFYMFYSWNGKPERLLWGRSVLTGWVISLLLRMYVVVSLLWVSGLNCNILLSVMFSVYTHRMFSVIRRNSVVFIYF